MMRNTIRWALVAFAAVCVTAASAHAALINVSLGTQDFTDSEFLLLGGGQFNLDSTDIVAPFDVFRGGDVAGAASFSESWTFGYAAITNPLESIIAASLQFGIFDHDSAHPGDQVAAFDVDGNAHTAALNALFNGSGGANTEYNVYTVDLMSLAFPDLRDGSATFSLSLQGPTPPAFSFLPPLPNNGAGLDFAMLTIETRVDDETPVPAPPTVLLLFFGIVGLLSRRRAC